jgi:PAS domain S-box-containing protein
MDTNLTFAEYKTLVEQSPIMIWRAALNAECDYFNERWLNFTGRPLDQEVGNGWATGVHPADLGRCLETYTTAFQERQPFEMEYRLRRADGEYRWLLDRGTPYADAHGCFAGYIGSCIDITAAVEAREKARHLREAELHRLRGMLPICAWCKKVRDDAGYWQAVEVYIQERSNLDFSHGLCPGCERKILAEA